MLTSILLGAVSGALAGALAFLVTRALPKTRRYYALVSILLFVTLYGLANATVGSGLKQRAARARAERAFDSIPAFHLIAQRHPEFKNSFVELTASLEREGASQDEAYARGVQWGRQNAAPYLLQYISRSSDSGAVLFAQAFTEAISTLRSQNVLACAEWLFGVAEGAEPHIARLNTDQEASMNNALNVVMSSATQSPNSLVDSVTGNRLVEVLLMNVQNEHGEDAINDIASLGQPEVARLNPSRACNATYVLYSTALKLPRRDVGPLIRFLFQNSAR